MATKSTKNMTKAEMAEMIAKLQAQLSAQTSEKEAGVIRQEQPVLQSQYTPNVTFTVPSTDVTVVYCSESLGYAKISNMELHFNKYGEEFVLSRTQFDELVGKYRKWFDTGILAVSSKNLDVAAAKGLRTDKENYLTTELLNSIGRMSARELEELWNKTDLKAHKESIVCFYKRKFIEGEASFLNREKVDLLNRLTAGGFKREQEELSGYMKINATEM